MQIIDREQRVAFIGISNWALDPAKMNRGVMVTRGDPDEKELELSARYKRLIIVVMHDFPSEGYVLIGLMIQSGAD